MSVSQNRQGRRRAASLGMAAGVAPTAARPGGMRALLDSAAQMRDRDQLGQALQLCQQAVRLEPNNPEIHFTAATVLEAGHDLANAVDAYRNVLRLQPGFLPALVNCAACLADLGELGDSIELYQAALKADPGSAVVRHNLAQALMRLNRAAEAVPHLRAVAAARQAPTDHGNLAEVLDLAGDRDAALAAYEEALKRGAPVAPTRVLMARVKLVRGNLDAARAHLAAALAALARHMQLYTEIMAHWHRTFPGRILDVGYEDLVAAPEVTVRQGVAHLGLDWEPACLEFHKTSREVRTASIAQVRRPLYTRSLGHWRNYERHLQPYMSRFDSFVTAYETGGDYGWGAGR